MAVLSSQLDACRLKRSELLVAERVLSELGPEDAPDVSGERRRDPTVGDQIVSFLYHNGPLRSHDLLALMQAEWRADLTFETLSSTLSRVKSTGRISHDNETKLWSAAIMAADLEKGSDSCAAEPSDLNGATGLAPTANGSAI